MEIASSVEKVLSHRYLLCKKPVIHMDTLYWAIRPNHRRLEIQSLDLNNGKQTILHKGDDSLIDFSEQIDFSKQGNLLYCITKQKGQSRDLSPSTITIWDMNTGDKLCSQTIGLEYSHAFPYKDSIILCDRKENNTIIWDYETQEKSIILNNPPFDYMDLYKDNLLIQGDDITVFDLTNQKTHFIEYFIENDESIYSFLAHAGMLMTLSIHDRLGTITISDIETGEKLREQKESSPFSGIQSAFFVVHKSKVLFGYSSSVKIFDFDPLKHYEQKMHKSLTGPLETKDGAELLMLAVMKKDREKILECVDNLIAADPRNREFIEILCENTEGDSPFIYEFITGTAFDYRKTIQTAPLHLIKKAVFEFTSKLKTDRNIQFNLGEFDQTLPNADSESE
ncbi:MAG TPA: hypothetical protein VNX68_16810 [Nitrosopumilaceae archaeon]|nr:hypothetical protein [Nitrosopumilaceae archaeon]